MDIKDRQEIEATLKTRYPLGIPRKEVSKATGGLLHVRSMANRDSLGTGIEGRFRMGKHVMYPVDELLNYLSKMMTDC